MARPTPSVRSRASHLTWLVLRLWGASLGLGSLGACVGLGELDSSSAPDGRLSPQGTVSTCADRASAPVLPREFSASCAGCHSAYGEKTSLAPDLFTFQGTQAEFVTRVREGGNGMPGLDAERISDPTLEGIFAYFRTGPSPAPSCTSAIQPSVCSGISEPLYPLFPRPTEREPLAVQSPDGAWELHGAGRVRGRHEQEAEFSLFHPRYFENRSYQFVILDTVSAGGTTVTFTWDSLGKTAQSPLTNFRYWYTRTGNVFFANVDMTRLSDTRYTWTVTQNEREKRAIRVGDLLEFEFGVFLDPSSVEGRTNYYTDTFRYVVGTGKLTPLDAPDDASLLGGGLSIPTLVAEPQLSFEQLGLNIQPGNIQKFLEGRRLFHTDFTTGEHTEPNNPAWAEQAHKAGPLFNQPHCAGCHVHNGRGAPPEPGQPASSTVLKVFASGTDATPHPDYGRQLQDRSVDNGPAEGSLTVLYDEEAGTFPDGTPYSLRRPRYDVRGLPGGLPLHSSVRVARPLVGMGLLEAVPEEVLLERADEQDCNQDGISGRANLLADPTTGVLRLGRFGWKASKVSVPHQVADALVADLGVTTSLFPVEDCGIHQSTCQPHSGKEPELSDEDVERLSTYMRLLGVPVRRNRKAPHVLRGELLFSQVGCSGCHAPSLVTGPNAPEAELRNQVIHPYSDLLLHDLGADLADHSTEHGAHSSEWRTPPLWGLGLTRAVSGHTQLLHDGRARSTTEAILWHGGEAAPIKARFMALSKEDREALLSFLDSL